MRFLSVLAVSLGLVLPVQAQTPAAGRLVAEVGGTVGGGIAASLGLPFVTAAGEAAFTGTWVAGGDTTGVVFVGDGVRWQNRDAGGAVLVGREAWMGADDDGRFVYSPMADGEDALWTDRGLLVRRGDPAPGFPGQVLTFASRPTLLPDGTAAWISGVSSAAGGGTSARAFYVSLDRTAASATVVLAEGQVVDGAPVTALEMSYGLSADGAHRAFLVTRATGSTATDGAVVLDGTVWAQEGSPVSAGSTERWSAFDLVRVNAAGDVLMAGDTSGPAASDAVVAFGSAAGGGVALREGSTVAGVTLGPTVRGLALNDAGVAVWAWTTSSGPTDEALFVGPADALASASALVLRTGQGLDTTGDGVADATVVGFAFDGDDGHGALQLGAAPVVYVRVDLVPAAGGPERTAIVGLDLAPYLVSSEAPAADLRAVEVSVAPNPSRADATATLRLTRPETVSVEILDVLGRRVARLHDGPLPVGEHTLSVPTAALPAGVYSVRVRGGAGPTTARFTVAR